MPEYALDLFGKYGAQEIQSIVDKHGGYWFLEQTIAEALGEDRHHILYLRQNYPDELIDGEHFTSISFDGKRRVVYSEEGFLTICDISRSDEAYRLRKWARKQFRVKQNGRDVIVTPKATTREDLSDLDPDLVLIQQMLDSLAEDRRRIKRLEHEQQEAKTEIDGLTDRANDTETRIATMESRSKIRPGEMTAVQLARHCGWVSNAGGPHNPAIVLAATNGDFFARQLIHHRAELDAGNRQVEVCVFTPEGVASFLSEIDRKYSSGDVFDIAPNAIALQRGLKNRRHVRKL